MDHNTDSQPSDSRAMQAQLVDMIWGFTRTQLVYIAARLKIADLLKNGSSDAQTLADAVEIDTRTLYRILRGLAWCGLVIHTEDDRFSLTPMGEYLRSDLPNSFYDSALQISEIARPSWNRIYETLKSNRTGFQLEFGMEFFEYFAKNEEVGRRFDRMMSKETIDAATNITNVYDFSTFKTIVDIGGGNGTLMTAILNANPNVRGIIFDLPNVIERTIERIKVLGITNRCEAVGGSFFETVPNGGDAYMMKLILHDWPDDRCITILKNCRTQMVEGGKLLVIDRVMPERASPSTPAVMWDLHMMMILKGIERTETEFRDLFSQAGFQLTQIIPTESGLCIVEGVPV